MNWIKSTKILPQDMEEVLLFDENNGLSVGYYFSETKSFIRHIDGLKLNNVLYWLPIPKIGIEE